MIQKLKSLIPAIALPVAMAVPVVAPVGKCGCFQRGNQNNQILDGAGTASGNDGLSCDNGGNICANRCRHSC